MNPKAHERRRGPQRGGERGGRPAGRTRSRQPIEPLHPTLTPPDIRSFAEWPLDPSVLQVIADMGIEVPTPIQRLAIQPGLEGRDIIAKAETGTGKTLAFGAPLVSRLDAARVSVLALVLCPTRELAEQVANVLSALGAPRGIRVALIVGGEPSEPQVQALKAGAQIVVGTPGRVLDLYGQRFLSFPWTEAVVLDEADVMFEIGFIDDIKKILALLPDERQTLLFSATFPPELLELARSESRDPVEIATASGVATVDTIDQCYMEVEDDDRPMALVRLIEQSAPEDVFLVFCDRRTSVDRLMRRLERIPFSIKALHGGYDQAARFRVMSAFRTGEVKALVATDVASRGLDVAHVTHVVNYAPPQDVTDYTHRIGRTGRAGRSGAAITFVTPETQRRWRAVLGGASWEIRLEPLPGRTLRGRGGRDEGRGRFDAPDERPARSEPDERPARGGQRERSARGGRDERRPRSEERGERGRGERAPRQEDDVGEGFGAMRDEPREHAARSSAPSALSAPARRDEPRGSSDEPRREEGGRRRRRGGRGRRREPLEAGEGAGPPRAESFAERADASGRERSAERPPRERSTERPPRERERSTERPPRERDEQREPRRDERRGAPLRDEAREERPVGRDARPAREDLRAESPRRREPGREPGREPAREPRAAREDDASRRERDEPRREPGRPDSPGRPGRGNGAAPGSSSGFGAGL